MFPGTGRDPGGDAVLGWDELRARLLLGMLAWLLLRGGLLAAHPTVITAAIRYRCSIDAGADRASEGACISSNSGARRAASGALALCLKRAASTFAR